MVCERWEGITVDGKFPLLEWMGGWSDRCIFLTVRQGIQKANIKLIPATGAEADAHLAYWNTARALAHPYLLQLMESGRCTVKDTEVVYVLTERVETFLSAIIPRKSPDPSEVKLILDPVVDALMFLHEKGFGHGSVRPSNIVLVGSQWKLTSEKITSEEIAGRKPDAYDAPEVSGGELTPAADVWSLGMILVEAFEHRTLPWDKESRTDPAVPDSLPEPFLEVARGCLRWAPEQRISIGEVKTLLAKYVAPSATTEPIPDFKEAVTAVKPDMSVRHEEETVTAAAASFSGPETIEFAPRSRMFTNLEEETEDTGRRGSIFWALLALLAIAGVLAVRGYRGGLFHSGETPSVPAQSQVAPQPAPQPKEAAPATTPSAPASTVQPATSSPVQPEPAQSQSTTPAPTATANQPAQTDAAPTAAESEPKEHAPQHLASTRGAVVKRVLPDVERGATGSMRRPMDVELRVSVNEEGRVANVQYLTRGPGNYFARKARQAAEAWRFKPPETEGQAAASEWILLFRFERRNVEVTATELH